MAELFTSSHNMQIVARTDIAQREEIFISPFDAQRFGIRMSEQYCVFGIQPLYPGPDDQEFAARLVIDANTPNGIIRVNNLLLENAGIQEGDQSRNWYVQSAPVILPIQQVVIEHPLDQGSVEREINDLRFRRNDFFVKRCMLVAPNKNIKDLTLRMTGRAGFYFRDIQPQLSTIREKTILTFEESTQINLFIPHRKSGVDMVVVVDGSGSMDLSDFVYAGRRRARLEGVRNALELLFQVRLVSGSRLASIAVIAFGSNAKMLYPFDIAMKKSIGEADLNQIRESVRHVNDAGLKKIGVDRTGTEISNGLKLASDLLDLYAQDNNEKVVVLLSDGADWHEDATDKGIGEVVRTSQDPVVLADNLRHDHEIRIHTVAISDENTFLRFYPEYKGKVGYVPNKMLLKKIAEFTDGMFLETPSADLLARIFEGLGEGSTYPIN